MGNNSSLFSILIIIVPIAVMFYFFSKRKKNQNNEGFDGTPKKAKKDEVWRTLKQYMQDNNERGKEIVYSFVAKRPNPMQEKATRKGYAQETQKYIEENKLDKKAAKKYKAKRTKEASRERYCIYFITRDPKTRIRDDARIIEAEVVQKSTGDKREPVKRSIVINGLQDFETEFKWIEPIKNREDEKIAKLEKQRAARQAKKDARKAKRTGRTKPSNSSNQSQENVDNQK